jgi:cytochrome c
MATAPKPQLNARGGKVELRLDSPTGKLIGESSMLEPTDKMDFTPSVLTVPVKLPAPADNKPHDVYLVFVNPKDPLGSLMVVMGVEAVMAPVGQ